MSSSVKSRNFLDFQMSKTVLFPVSTGKRSEQSERSEVRTLSHSEYRERVRSLVSERELRERERTSE